MNGWGTWWVFERTLLSDNARERAPKEGREVVVWQGGWNK